jgi:hypothetical protein
MTEILGKKYTSFVRFCKMDQPKPPDLTERM